MRTNLVVPFSEKDEAKALGARWDPAKKLWYVDKVPDLAPFARWLSPAGATPSSSARSGPAKPPATTAAAEIKTGAGYLPLACDCLPWEGCEKCRSALSSRAWSP